MQTNNNSMYTFELDNSYLTDQEQKVFDPYLAFHGLDPGIWEIYRCLFKSATRHTRPLILRAFRNGELCGAAILIKGKRYGRSLFSGKLPARLVNLAGIPFFLWIKFGCCMDMMSNPGFARDPDESDEVFKAMVTHLKKRNLLTIVNDYSANEHLYDRASVAPALPHGLIDVSSMTTEQDYMKDYKNLKRKLKVFANKGGEYIRAELRLDENLVSSMEKCFLATAEKSVFYLPYQDLYLSAAMETSRTSIARVHYFIATINGEFIGYQAAIQTGSHLNALHGAFDRNLKTTYHAYDILFLKMAEFAIEQGLQVVDFGAVINHTKQKMVNRSIPMSYYVLSKYPIIQKAFTRFFKITRIQGDDHLKFRVEQPLPGADE